MKTLRKNHSSHETVARIRENWQMSWLSASWSYQLFRSQDPCDLSVLWAWSFPQLTIQAALQLGSICVPRTIHGRMEICRSSILIFWKRRSFGLLGPNEKGRFVDQSKLIWSMYLAWSSSQKVTEGGYGGGYYDRYLNFTGKTVSTIYSIQRRSSNQMLLIRQSEVLVYEVTLWSSLSCDQPLIARLAAVFLSMFIRFGGSYQTGAAIYYGGGIIGEVVKADPDQLWRIVTATLFILALGDHPSIIWSPSYYLGRLAEDALWIESFLSSLSLIRHDGQCLCRYFTPDVIAARASTALFWTAWDHWYFAYCPKSLYSHQSQSKA